MPRANGRLAQLGLVALLALAPKCLVCGLAYAGLLGLGGAELCGEAPAAWSWGLPVIAGALGAAGFLLHQFAQRHFTCFFPVKVPSAKMPSVTLPLIVVASIVPV